MKMVMPVIAEAIRTSYQGRQNPELTERVIKDIEKHAGKSKKEFLSMIDKMPANPFNEWRLWVTAWQVTEKTIEYPFEIGQEVKFNRRKRTIMAIHREDRTVTLENLDVVSLYMLRPVGNELEQLTLF